MAETIGEFGARRRGASPDDSRAVIQNALQPGEKLLWHARGSGVDVSVQAVSALIFIGVWTVGWSYGVVILLQSFATPPLTVFAMIAMGAIFAPVLAFAAVRSFLAPAYDRYGLTDRRIIIVERFWPPSTRSFPPASLHRLHVTENAGRGDVRFLITSGRKVSRVRALFGIDRPAHVADLIRTTLRPDLKVESRATARRAPA